MQSLLRVLTHLYITATKYTQCYLCDLSQAVKLLTTTSLSSGKTKNSTPHRMKTPIMIEIKFGTVDYISQVTPHAKFYVNLTKEASWQIGEIYATIFVAIHMPFFLQCTYRSDPLGDFYTQQLKRCDHSQGANLSGLKNENVLFNVFIRKI